MICMKKLRFPSRPRAKVRRQGSLGSTRAHACQKMSINPLTKVLCKFYCHLAINAVDIIMR